MSKASCACRGGLVAVVVVAAAAIHEKERKEEHKEDHKQEQEQEQEQEDSRRRRCHRGALTVVEAVSHSNPREIEKRGGKSEERARDAKAGREGRTATGRHETRRDDG
mmetsp:Transcript_20024/g.56764  ORF Transcript_20024/g.56764 Transcript_20024/m.56764 type:complete len:108 (+) Transcript_20024:51-374(+)